ncbi:MAG: hypothetical protein HC923_13060 [Myxococcales bacterium]|nr:hypothetical protein [Myxococcales bacterium]
MAWAGLVLNYVYTSRHVFEPTLDQCNPTAAQGVLRDGSCPDREGCFLDEIRRTGGDFFFACNLNWQNEVLDNHLGILGHHLRFHVVDPPAAETLQVFVDGFEVPAGPTTWNSTSGFDWSSSAKKPNHEPTKSS